MDQLASGRIKGRRLSERAYEVGMPWVATAQGPVGRLSGASI